MKRANMAQGDSLKHQANQEKKIFKANNLCDWHVEAIMSGCEEDVVLYEWLGHSKEDVIVMRDVRRGR
jgi:hypothetical protein